jgi:enterobactin synthetase component F
LHAALRLTLRRFAGDDEMAIRVGDADAGMRVAVGDADSFRTIVRAVRDATLHASHLAGALNRIVFRDAENDAWECTVSIGAQQFELEFIGYAPAFRAIEESIPAALTALLVAAAADPDCPGNALPLTDPLHVQRLVRDGDGPLAPAPALGTLDRIVADRAFRAPDAIAVVEGGVSISYGALLTRAAFGARMLRSNGIEPGMRVGVCAAPCAALFATILAIWSVGAVYVPLDPALPDARLAGIASGAALALAVVASENAGRLGACPVLSLTAGTLDVETWPSVAAATGNAYLLYTSGSTGEPKGVEIPHRAATNAILAALAICGLRASDSTLYRTAISFDLSVYDIFTSLAAGATLVIAPAGTTGDPNALMDAIAVHEITHVLLGPTLLAAMLDRSAFERCRSLRLVTCGGEALSWALCERFFERSQAQLYNLYGPSEAAMLVTLHPCRPGDALDGEVTAPLGFALANCHVSVRDANSFPVPPGAIGEIVIAGVQLASGYINTAEETRKRFVADPARPGERLYRTGDLARRNHSGSITYLGRNDNQVKIRGIRVEPGEVAATLERIPGVKTAVVCAQRRVAGDPESIVLVAYVALRSRSALNAAGIRHALGELVPSHLVPSEIVIVDVFPLTQSGKIDEKALVAAAPVAQRKPVRNASTAAIGFSVRGILREQLRAMWEGLLGIGGIGDDDDFFDLGGDSLLALRLTLAIEETFGQSIAIADFVTDMTIAGLAKLLADDSAADVSDAFAFNQAGTQPPFVYLHGDFAGGRYAWSLAPLLGADQPLTVIPPHGLRGRPPATTVPKMAADVAATVARMHPDGPLRIGGFSAAGLVAYEAARLLRAAGRDVTETVLVATNLRATLRTRVGRFMQLPWRRRVRRVVDIVFRRRAPEHRAIEIELGRDYQMYEAAHDAYVPRPYDGRVRILWPAGERTPYDAVLRDWRKLVRDVAIESIPGTHLGAVSRHLGDIAAALRADESERRPAKNGA